jgi:hypothetical protein
MSKIGVFIIHGMGDPEPGYASGLIRRLEKRLGAARGRVEWEACYWAPILEDPQDRVWEKLLRAGRMDARALRRWVLSALGDPATYLSGFFKSGQPVYSDVHECIRTSLRKLEARLGSPDRPLVVLAHSLGSVMVSNYIWDETHNPTPMGLTAFERMETLTGFITYGSNIPLFVPPAPRITCIRFPSAQLPAAYKPAAAWENVYDPDDVLGYPLNGLWDETQGTVITDLPINAGGALGLPGESPLSHVLYDRDGDFLQIVERRLRMVLDVA